MINIVEKNSSLGWCRCLGSHVKVEGASFFLLPSASSLASTNKDSGYCLLLHLFGETVACELEMFLGHTHSMVVGGEHSPWVDLLCCPTPVVCIQSLVNASPSST